MPQKFQLELLSHKINKKNPALEVENVFHTTAESSLKRIRMQ